MTTEQEQEVEEAEEVEDTIEKDASIVQSPPVITNIQDLVRGEQE